MLTKWLINMAGFDRVSFFNAERPSWKKGCQARQGAVQFWRLLRYYSESIAVPKGSTRCRRSRCVRPPGAASSVSSHARTHLFLSGVFASYYAFCVDRMLINQSIHLLTLPFCDQQWWALSLSYSGDSNILEELQATLKNNPASAEVADKCTANAQQDWPELWRCEAQSRSWPLWIRYDEEFEIDARIIFACHY